MSIMNIHPNLDVAQGSTGPQPLRPAVSAVAGAASATGSNAASGAIADEDTANISSAGLSAAASSELSDVRAGKVAEIQQALAEGTYSVSPLDVAGKLIDHLLQR